MGQLRELLTTYPRSTLYAVADAATLPGLLDPMYALGRRCFACLLRGEVASDVAHVAPYLIALREESPLIDWLESRLDLPWGYVVESNLPLLPLQLHLRRFSETRGPHGEEWLFRFWDPRVLRTMAAILTPAQGEAFMQGISCIYLFEAGAATPLRVQWDTRAGRLRFSDEEPVAEQGAAHAGV